jgi:hypothetical protein
MATHGFMHETIIIAAQKCRKCPDDAQKGVPRESGVYETARPSPRHEIRALFMALKQPYTCVPYVGHGNS